MQRVKVITPFLKIPKLIGLMVLFVGTNGCSLFTSYPEMHAQGMHDFASGNFSPALSHWSSEETGDDAFLHHLERGLIAQTAGELERSNQEFFIALDWQKEWEDRPTVSMRGGVEEALSFVLNDKTLPYDGEGFERVLLHSYLGLNFYLMGKYDGAYVETRRAYEMQREEEERYSTRYATQSAFARYLSGMVRETIREPGEAYLDYQKVWELSPRCEWVKEDLLRLSSQLGYAEDYKRWKSEFKRDVRPASLASSTADCIVFFHCGQSPVKVPIEIVIPFHSGVTKWVAPAYQKRSNPVQQMRFLVNGEKVGTSLMLENIEGIAFKNLDDRLAWISAKATTRAVAKGVLTHNLFQREEWVGALLGTLFTLATEQPDLRSWLTLPRNIQLLRTPLNPGQYDFSVELLDHSGKVISQSSIGRYIVRPGERVVFNLRSVGRSTFTYVAGGQKIKGDGP